MSNSVPLLSAFSVTNVVGLKERPVYFITLNNANAPSVVVKGENQMQGLSNEDAEISIRWTSKLMKNVNNKAVNTKLMTAGEIHEFKKNARRAYDQGTPQRGNLDQPYRWVKMPYVAGLSDAEMYNSDWNQFDSRTLKPLLKRFLDEQVWDELGAIVAVDIFNGNNDRLMFDAPPGAQASQINVQWSNLGNIMFLTGGATSVIGLDTLDPSGAGGRSNLGSGQADLAVLQLLNDTNRASRKEFAVNCTRAIAAEIKRTMSKTGTDSVTVRVVDGDAPRILRIYKESAPGKTGLEELLAVFADPFLDGFNRGITRMKTYLQGKRNQYGNAGGWVSARRPGQKMTMGSRSQTTGKQIPRGVQDRMRALGW